MICDFGTNVQGFVFRVDVFKKFAVFVCVFHHCLTLCVIYSKWLWLEIIVGVLPNMQRVGDNWGVSPNSIPAFMEALDTLHRKNRLREDIAFHLNYAFEWIHPFQDEYGWIGKLIALLMND